MGLKRNIMIIMLLSYGSLVFSTEKDDFPFFISSMINVGAGTPYYSNGDATLVIGMHKFPFAPLINRGVRGGGNGVQYHKGFGLRYHSKKIVYYDVFYSTIEAASSAFNISEHADYYWRSKVINIRRSKMFSTSKYFGWYLDFFNEFEGNSSNSNVESRINGPGLSVGLFFRPF